MMAGDMQAYQQLKPCIAPGQHKFTAHFPPPGQYGYTRTVCERCGMTRKEALL